MPADTPPPIDSRRRLVLLGLAMVVACGWIAARIAALELTWGDAYRAEADRPRVRFVRLPAPRGRIIAADGSLFAQDETTPSLAIHYRWLESPPQSAWLRQQARARLPKSAWREPGRLAQAEQEVLAERRAWRQRWAQATELTDDEFERRAAAVQARVEALVAAVGRAHERRQAEAREQSRLSPHASTFERLVRAVADQFHSPDDDTPPPLVLREEIDFHRVVDDLTPAMIARLESLDDVGQAARIVERARRRYPLDVTAAHVIGYLGAPSPEDLADLARRDELPHPDDRVGVTGLEQSYESTLRGVPGRIVERLDRRGRPLELVSEERPIPGRDVRLALIPELQRTAEGLLDATLAARAGRDPGAPPAGGAVVLIDVHDGSLLALASAPRFGLEAFARGDSSALHDWQQDAAHPLFHRAVQMALPPGSTFKLLTAIALLESETVTPAGLFDCTGYWPTPEGRRCLLYRRFGHGHGATHAADALAWSCNTYFFHHVQRLGAEPLIAWGTRCGFGRPTLIDLPAEAAGQLPEVGPLGGRGVDVASWGIGQGSVTATPLQIACLTAVLANGGRPIRPRVVAPTGGEALPTAGVSLGFRASTLAAIRRGMERAVADEGGTAHAGVWNETLTIAGKTGTAETGRPGGDHAWFAGYAPIDRPQVAVVVVVEHGGEGGSVAGPIARRLLLEWERRRGAELAQRPGVHQERDRVARGD